MTSLNALAVHQSAEWPEAPSAEATIARKL